MSAPPARHTDDEAWKTYANTIPLADIGETVTTRHYMAAAAARNLAVEPPASGVPELTTARLPELPLIPIALGGEAPAKLDAVDFEVTGVLGEGGMGRVLLARQRSLRRDVAIKVIKAEVQHPEVIEALLAEAGARVPAEADVRTGDLEALFKRKVSQAQGASWPKGTARAACVVRFVEPKILFWSSDGAR